MKITSNEARALSKEFRELSISLGNHRFDHWEELTPGKRQQIEDLEWTLLNFASDLTTMAVGLTLDESKASMTKIKKSINKAKTAVKTLNDIKKIIKVAESGVQLAAAILSKDPGAIAKAIGNVYNNATA